MEQFYVSHAELPPMDKFLTFKPAKLAQDVTQTRQWKDQNLHTWPSQVCSP